jgi:hypothetical protein
MRRFLTALHLLLLSSAARAQDLPEILRLEPTSLGAGWQGFADLGFLTNALLTLTLAAVLGAAIAYHPKLVQSADTPEEIEAAKVYITYSVIGALVGIMVVKYGLVVGFVLFGIGGLIRFRTVLQSANLTGHAIFVTLIGLACGLDLPHVAVLATVFGIVLLYVLDMRRVYRIDVRALAPERVGQAAAAYRTVLEGHGCRILSERKNPEKARVTFIFRSMHRISREQLEELLDCGIDPSLRGSRDWKVD